MLNFLSPINQDESRDRIDIIESLNPSIIHHNHPRKWWGALPLKLFHGGQGVLKVDFDNMHFIFSQIRRKGLDFPTLLRTAGAPCCSELEKNNLSTQR